jgi:uncharacterized damage-inducible protein DinB
MSSLAKMIDDYLAGPKTLRQAVAGLSSDQLRARPVPGKWSTLEVVCHIADFEPIYGDRMKRVIAMDHPTLLAGSPDRFAATLAYHERDMEEELDIVERTRQQMGRILRKLPDEALQRVGIHEERGPQTLEQLLSTITRHIPHHVEFIREKRKHLGIGG